MNVDAVQRCWLAPPSRNCVPVGVRLPALTLCALPGLFVASSPLSRPDVPLRDGTTMAEHYLNCNRLFSTLQSVHLNETVLGRGRRFAEQQGARAARDRWRPPPTLWGAVNIARMLGVYTRGCCVGACAARFPATPPRAC